MLHKARDLHGDALRAEDGEVGSVVEVEIVDRADFAILGVQRVAMQIPRLVQHAF